MQQRQVITYRVEGVLVERLRELAAARRFWLRETSQLPACQNLLKSGSTQVWVMRLGEQLERELALLEQVHACLPNTRTIVIGEADNPVLAGLVWELGATIALFPPTPLETITELMEGLLRENPP